MKKEHDNFWVSADDNRNPPYCTVYADGILSLGKFMHESLSDTILIKFLDDSCTLVIKDSENDVGIRNRKRISMKILAGRLIGLGLTLPIDFLFEYNEQARQWEGYPTTPIRKRKQRSTKPVEIMTGESKLLIPAYTKMINRIIYTVAKSTPIEERRATAEMALCIALHEHNPVLGSLNQYIEKRIREELIKQNIQYTKINRFNSKSLDAPIKEGENPKFGDFLMTESTLRLQNTEASMEMGFFLQSINDPKISRLIKKLRDGYTVDEICDEIGIKYAQFSELCNKAAKLWKDYNIEE